MPSTQTRIRWWLIAIYGLAIGFIILLVLWYAKIDPIYGTLNSIGASIGKTFSGFNSGGILKVLDDNKVALAGGAVTLIPMVYATIKSKMSESATKSKLAAEQELSKIASDAADEKLAAVQAANSEKITQLTKEIEQYKSDPIFDTVTQLKTENTRILSQVDSIQDIHNRFVNQFYQSKNGEMLKDPLTGELYKILEKPPVTIVR